MIHISLKFALKNLISNMSANDLTQNRQQAIIWTYDDVFYWCI